MLHAFRVSNYQSIRDEVALDFRVPRTTPDRPCFRRTAARAGSRLPAVIVFVGPNGAGKSALLRALGDTIRFMAHSYGYRQGSILGFPAFLDPEGLAMHTQVEMEFDATWPGTGNGSSRRRFRYSLDLERENEEDYFPARVHREVLFDFPKGRPRRLVARHRNRPVYVAKDVAMRPGDERLSHIPDNASVISTLARLGVKTFAEIAEDLGTVQMNVTAVDPMRPDPDTTTHYYRDNPEVKDLISRELGRFDLGIEGMDVVLSPEGKWRLLFRHDGLALPVPFENESAGTRHVVHAFPALNYALSTGKLAVMDALDNDLHTSLVSELLNRFRHEHTNPHGAQLICSLHNYAVFEELEKEEIFVVEKRDRGATEAFGLGDMIGLRRRSNLQKQYRSGVLGGIPRFG